MSQKPDAPSRPRIDYHCQHINGRGHRCRMSVDNGHTPPHGEARPLLCAHHLNQLNAKTSAPDPELLTAELLGSIEDFQTAEAVNLFLGNLLKQLAAQRIERRDAIALAYISQLLLSSLPALDRQRAEERQARELDEIAKSIKAHHAARLAAASAAAKPSSQAAPVSASRPVPQHAPAPPEPGAPQPPQDYASLR